MKKHLIAAAIAGAFVAPAFAQNVQIYGVIDQTITQTDTAGVGATTTSGSGQLATSIIGLKGSEDLGGGMKASFDLQGELLAQTGSGSGVSAGTGFAFNRQSWVAISGGFGTVKQGRTGTYIDQNYGGAAHGAVFLLPSASARANSAKYGGTTEYVSPELVKGLTVSFQHISAQSDSTVSQANSGYSYGANYASGAVTVAVGATVMNSATAQDSTSSVAAFGYDLGVAKLNVTRLQSKQNATTATNADTSSLSVGASIPLAGGITAIVNYENFEDKQSTTTDYKRIGALVKKDLSKRTSVFAGYKSQDTGATGADIDTTVIGLQHSF
jgi:predicted porin